MKIYKNPEKEQWAEIIARPHLDHSQLQATVSSVLNDVRERGDQAVLDYEERFDHVRLSDLAVTQEELDEAESLVSDELKESITLAHHNIDAFHRQQVHNTVVVETQPGVKCWQRSVSIEKVGLYIPGGTAPLFSTVLMLATPAKALAAVHTAGSAFQHLNALNVTDAYGEVCRKMSCLRVVDVDAVEQ